MLRVYAPAAVALLAIVSLTVFEAKFSDRFSSSAVTAEEFGKRFADIPKVVGPWMGVDMKESKETLKMAGAVRHVSRRYTNQDNNTSVDLWLIVGHSRDVCRHTPNICYPSHGYAQRGAVVKQQIIPPSTPDDVATFFTAKFTDDSPTGRKISRVFWAFNGNTEGKYKWEAPEPKSLFSWLPVKSTGPKTYYGNNAALYKMYFTTETDLEEPVGESTAIEFAELMLPRINQALFPERYPGAATSDDSAGASESAEALAAPNAETAPSGASSG
jgi:hypothetical protein